MSLARLCSLAIVGGFAFLVGITRADYPIASHRYLADPSVIVTKDRVYVYCSNDDESPLEGSYNIPNVVCISTSDMKNWTDHGVVFDAKADTKWAKKSWAPSGIARDGKYYLYFGNGGSNIGVVVADNPLGPFKDVKGTYLINSDTPGVKPFEKGWLFDPAVFIDDDGQAYIYFGGNGDDKLRVAKLGRDMVSLDGEVMKLSAPNFFEASWMHKRNGVYYFSYSTNPKSGLRIDYMTSDQPTKNFTYRGTLAGQPPINHDNNHACEFEFKGQWYHVYHNRIVAHDAGIPMGFRRNLALETFEYDPDGSIKQVKYTPDGVPQLGHVDPRVRNEGETFHAQHGIKTEACSAGGMDLTAIGNGDWVRVRGVDFGPKGPARFLTSVAAEANGGSVELRLDGDVGELIGTCKVPVTGGAQKWQTISCPVSNVHGVHDLYLKFTGVPEQALFNLDWWQFQ